METTDGTVQYSTVQYGMYCSGLTKDSPGGDSDESSRGFVVNRKILTK